MNFNEYQTKARLTAEYPGKGRNIIYPVLGLAGEAGEVVERVKKLWRNEGITDGKAYKATDKIAIMKELGDVLWYVASISSELAIPLEFIASENLLKLNERYELNLIKSDSEERGEEN